MDSLLLISTSQTLKTKNYSSDAALWGKYVLLHFLSALQPSHHWCVHRSNELLFSSCKEFLGVGEHQNERSVLPLTLMQGVQDRGAWQAPQPMVTARITYPKLVSCSQHQLYALAFKVSGSGYSPDTVFMVDRERWIQRAPGHLQTNLSMWSKVSEAAGYQCLPLPGLPCLCSMCAESTKHHLSA